MNAIITSASCRCIRYNGATNIELLVVLRYCIACPVLRLCCVVSAFKCHVFFMSAVLLLFSGLFFSDYIPLFVTFTVRLGGTCPLIFCPLCRLNRTKWTLWKHCCLHVVYCVNFQNSQAFYVILREHEA